MKEKSPCEKLGHAYIIREHHQHQQAQYQDWKNTTGLQNPYINGTGSFYDPLVNEPGEMYNFVTIFCSRCGDYRRVMREDSDAVRAIISLERMKH